MKLSEKLQLVASWLNSEDNDLLVKAEENETHLDIVAIALVKAAQALQEGAEEIDKIEPVTNMTPEKLDEIAALATVCDQSNDEWLQKQASVLDELLLTFAAPKSSLYDIQKLEENRLEELKKKYQNTKEEQDKSNKVADSVKAIEKSEVAKTFRPLEAPLSTRYCPDHGGVSTIRVGEHTVQCPLDRKIYSYEQGYTLLNGEKVKGGDVSLQTPMSHDTGHLMFSTETDTRAERMGIDTGEKK